MPDDEAGKYSGNNINPVEVKSQPSTYQHAKNAPTLFLFLPSSELQTIISDTLTIFTSH